MRPRSLLAFARTGACYPSHPNVPTHHDLSSFITFSMSSEDSQTPQGSAIFDSLPYYDNDLERDSSLKDKAEKLIAKELGKQPEALHPRVPPPINIFAVRARTIRIYP